MRPRGTVPVVLDQSALPVMPMVVPLTIPLTMPLTGPLVDTAAAIRVCTACALHTTRQQAVPGEGVATARLVVVGEAPGATEDAMGRPFVGRSGQFLRRLLGDAGWTMADVFITNSVRCRPPANRPPVAAERDACAQHLRAELLALRAATYVVLLGRTAAMSVLECPGNLPMSRLRGRWVGPWPAWMRTDPIYRARPWIVTYHPAAALRNPVWREALIADLAALRSPKPVRSPLPSYHVDD